MTIQWNGEKTEAFTPKKGLRQGDPLSPYLFVMCLERLCHLIDEAVIQASVAQVRVIRGILERFCIASGQKVSLEKSKTFISQNVSRELGKLISDESGISSTRELGKYLGMPVLQKRINKDTFGEVLEKVSSWLAGWKGQLLSLAGRITLTKAVLSSVPVHTMSTAMLPQSTLNRLDKKEGALGIRKAKEMNTALLAKLGWRLLHNEISLWAKVLRSKYKVKEVKDAAWFSTKGNWSSTWRSVLRGMRDVVIPGMNWMIGNGRTTRFWKDKWLSGQSSVELATTEILEALTESRVSDLWQSGSGWLLTQIEPYVSVDTRLRLAAVVVDEVTGGRDRMSWGLTQDGEFSVTSAYSFLTQDTRPRQCMAGLFTRAWHVVVPERVRVFLWLLGGAGNGDVAMYIFESNGKCRDRVKFIKDIAKEVASAYSFEPDSGGMSNRVERHIAWKPPMQGWWKINTDGASRGNPGLATAGGVLRDENGSWKLDERLHPGTTVHRGTRFILPSIGLTGAPCQCLVGSHIVIWYHTRPRQLTRLSSESSSLHAQPPRCQSGWALTCENALDYTFLNNMWLDTPHVLST
ncbi:unnamed protein product [Microthlaspi erraticum]|uniref:Reverse transcriptase domain-containing protein n=1 Tax=Microthlaspi erraticum TaxID=1685480 RepID=A0A6D2I7G2_9BRAS|nr:unnamed protein product [Microthlaspi erraticum]